MQVDILTPDKTIFTGEVNAIQLPGADGSFQLLNNHAPLIATLAKGKIKVESAEKEILFFDIGGGVLECLNNKVIVLAENA